MKTYDYDHRGVRDVSTTASGGSTVLRADPRFCIKPVYRHSTHSMEGPAKTERAAIRKQGTWCGPMYRLRTGHYRFKVHHSGPLDGSRSELEHSRLAST